MFRGDEVGECPVLKKLKLTANEMLRRKAVRFRARWLDDEQQAETAQLWSKVKYYEGHAPFRSTPVSTEGNSSNKRTRARCKGSGREESTPEEPERKWDRTM